jgi:hypothetical protein
MTRNQLIRWFLRNTTKDRDELAEYSDEELREMYDVLMSPDVSERII